MSPKSKLFLDTEFTGLHQKSSLISLGMVAEDGSDFYAEFTDYAPEQITDWLKNNVMNHLLFKDWEDNQIEGEKGSHWRLKGDRSFITKYLREYLKRFDQVACWLDYAAYDWVLFCELFGGSMHLPPQLYYIPFDLPTLFLIKNIDPDISRESFLEGELSAHDQKGVRHNSLWDAQLTYMAYQKLMRAR